MLRNFNTNCSGMVYPPLFVVTTLVVIIHFGEATEVSTTNKGSAAMKEEQQSLQISILDRLVDREPSVSSESVQYRFHSFGQIKVSVVRDLENLLNTRCCVLPPPALFRELSNSLYVYGLADFTSRNPKSLSVRQQLRLEIEKKIFRFESRLKNVSVHFEEHTQNKQSLRFRISALLVVEPIKEPVTFDTYLDINKQKYSIRE